MPPVSNKISIFSAGLSQPEKYLMFLDPDMVPVDPRTAADDMAFIFRFAGQVNYYNKDNEIDGSWQPFFSASYLFSLAHVATTNVTSESNDNELFVSGAAEYMKSLKAFSTFHEIFGIVPTDASHKTRWDEQKKVCESIYAKLYAAIYRIAQRINEWYRLFTTISTSNKFYIEVEGAIKTSLSSEFYHLYQYRVYHIIRPKKWAPADSFPIAQFSYNGSPWLHNDNGESWVFQKIPQDAPKDKSWLVDYPDTPSVYRLVQFYQNHFKYLENCLWDFSKVQTYLLKIANTLLNAELTFVTDSARDQKPHIALTVAFLDMLKAARQITNQYSGEHLDFYYKSILNTGKQLATPDMTYLLFPLKKGASRQLVPAYTQVSGGTDSVGNQVLFATSSPYEVNNAALQSVSNLYLLSSFESNQTATSPADVGIVSGIFISSFPSDPTAIGSGWYPFGEDNLRKTISDPYATIGFAVSTPLLFLSEGTRTFTLTITFLPECMNELVKLINKEYGNPEQADLDFLVNFIFINSFVCSITSAKSWLILENSSLQTVAFSAQANTVTMNVTLPVSADPIVAFDPKIHSGSFDTAWPVLKFTLADGPLFYGYSFLSKLIISSIGVSVNVTGVKTLIMSNSVGNVDATKPFQFFGPVPVCGSWLAIGNAEIAQKYQYVSSVSFVIEWFGLPQGSFSKYYEVYWSVPLPSANTSSTGTTGTPTAGVRNPAPPLDSDSIEPVTNNSFQVSVAISLDGTWRVPAAAPVVTSGIPLFVPITTPPGLPQGPGGPASAPAAGDANTPVNASDNASSDNTPSGPAASPQNNGNNADGINDVLPGTNTITIVGNDVLNAPPDSPLYSAVITPTLPNGYYRIQLMAPCPFAFGNASYPIVLSAVTYNNAMALIDYSEKESAGKKQKRKEKKANNNAAAPAHAQAQPASFPANGGSKKAGTTTSVTPVTVATASVLPLPNLPYVPTVQTLVVNYTASITYNYESAGTGNAAADFKVFHINPFTQYVLSPVLPDATGATQGAPLSQPSSRTLIANTRRPEPKTANAAGANATNNSGNVAAIQEFFKSFPSWKQTDSPLLLPYYSQHGYMFINFSNIVANQSVQVIFEIVSENATHSEELRYHVMWEYLSGDQWVALQPSKQILDGTDKFVRTGIVKLILPPDIFNTSITMPDGNWVRCSVAAISKVQCRLLNVQTQAVEAVRVIGQNTSIENIGNLPAATLNKFVVAIPAISQIIQPMPSVGGRYAENERDYYNRISEILKHKGRAITASDYERLVLQEYPFVYYARCIAHSRPWSDNAPGSVLVLVISGLNDNPDNLAPRFSMDILNAIKNYLAKTTEPTVKLVVCNPIYIFVCISCTVSFHEEDENDTYIKKLNSDLQLYFSPWLTNNSLTNNIAIDNNSSKGSESAMADKINLASILNYIMQLKYIKYVDNSLTATFFEDKGGIYELMGDELMKPWHILASVTEHNLSILGTGDFDVKKGTGITGETGVNFMEIGSNFVVS